MPGRPDELAPGLWSWARRHPEWHPGDFGTEVVCFGARGGNELVLVDPMLVGDDDPVWDLIEASASNAAEAIRIFVTITYHVRSAETIRDRLSGRLPVTIHGHPAVAKRLTSDAGFEPFGPGDEAIAGVTAHPVGRPRRYETPLLLSSHAALVFGDAVVGTAEGPRIWAQEKIDERVLRFNRERFGPSLEPLLELDFDRLLMTHGPSVLSGGRDALQAAIDADPWFHRPA